MNQITMKKCVAFIVAILLIIGMFPTYAHAETEVERYTIDTLLGSEDESWSSQYDIDYEELEKNDLDLLTSNSIILTRLYGLSAYDTSAEVALHGRTSADTVIMVSGATTAWPDAVSASGLSAVLEAPVLATDPQNLQSSTWYALDTLSPSKIILIGGRGALSLTLENQIRISFNGIAIERIAGSSGIETAEEVYKYVPSSSWINPNGSSSKPNFNNWKNPDGKKAAVIATSRGFADGLSAASITGTCKYPIFLTNTDGTLTQATKNLLSSGNFDEVIAVGGASVVPMSTINEAVTLINPVPNHPNGGWFRAAGPSLYETSVSCIMFLNSVERTEFDQVCIATGANHVDAISGTGLGYPILLVDPLSNVYQPSNGNFAALVMALLARNSLSDDELIVLGGRGAIPDAYAYQLMSAWFDFRVGALLGGTHEDVQKEVIDKLSDIEMFASLEEITSRGSTTD